MKIDRHKFTMSKMANEDTLAHYKNRVEKSFSRIAEGKKVNLYKLKDTPLNIAKTSIINSDYDSVFQNLDLMLEFGIGHIKRTLSNDSVLLILKGNECTMSALDDNYGASYFDWFFLYSIANLCRSNTHLNDLRSIDLMKINPVSHPFWSIVYKYLIGISNNDKEAVYTGIEQIRATAKRGAGLFIDDKENKSEVVFEDGDRLLSTLWSPVLELYDCVFYNKPDQFNAVLGTYLKNKKEYIIENELEDDPRYWIDFPALGVCALAIDNNMEISIESDYIPQWVYTQLIA